MGDTVDFRLSPDQRRRGSQGFLSQTASYPKTRTGQYHIGWRQFATQMYLSPVRIIVSGFLLNLQRGDELDIAGRTPDHDANTFCLNSESWEFLVPPGKSGSLQGNLNGLRFVGLNGDTLEALQLFARALYFRAQVLYIKLDNLVACHTAGIGHVDADGDLAILG